MCVARYQRGKQNSWRARARGRCRREGGTGRKVVYRVDGPGCIHHALICKICSFEELTGTRAYKREEGGVNFRSVSGWLYNRPRVLSITYRRYRIWLSGIGLWSTPSNLLVVASKFVAVTCQFKTIRLLSKTDSHEKPRKHEEGVSKF